MVRKGARMFLGGVMRHHESLWNSTTVPRQVANIKQGTLKFESGRLVFLMEPLAELKPSRRLLLGPGPSMLHPRVLKAIGTPLLGHLDPEFLQIMDEVQASLRWLFHTQNSFTIAVSGTGSAAMETAIVNLVEPGDSVIVGINGIFGTRLASMVERCGGKVIPLEVPWGQWIDPGQIERLLHHSGPVKAVALVHAETSTGVHQPIAEIGTLCRNHDALFIVDTVTSLGGMPVDVDGWEIDVCYSATQKCLSCPPGLAPLTLSDRAMAGIKKRRHPCHSWYLDCSLVADYWNDTKRTYHHTAPVSMIYALRESLRLVQEEGLEERIVRHRLHSDALIAGLQILGFPLLPDLGHHLPPLTCVQVPSHLDELGIRKKLLNEFDIEIGGGLGPLAGKVWRIGLMGESSRLEHVLMLLSALEQILGSTMEGVIPGESLKAAAEIFATAQPPQ